MMDDPKSCPSSFLFLSCTEFFDYGTSPYAFCNSNPVNYVDVDGEFPDFIWDFASIGMGVRNLVDNIQEGNTRAAIGDGVGRVLNMPHKSVKGKKADMNQAEVDHIVPKSKGGTNANDNLQILSKEENLKKSNIY